MRTITLIFMMAFVVVSQSLMSQSSTDQLKALYSLNGNAQDESGNDFHGTQYNIEPTTNVFGDSNSAAQFNGSGAYIQLPDLNITSFPISFSCYLNIETTDLMYVYTSDYWAASSAIYSGFNVSVTGGRVYAAFGNGSGSGAETTKIYLTDIVLNTHTWYHLVVVYAHYNDIRIYLNGQQIPTTVANNQNLTQISFNNFQDRLGKSYYFDNRYDFKGKLDQVKIFTTAIDAITIEALHYEFLNNVYTVISTNSFFVSSNEFEPISPKFYLKSVNSLGLVGGVNTVQLNFDNYVYNPTFCSVTDTLIINVNLTGVNPPNNNNIVKVYPNPASDYIIVHTGNYQYMSNYTITINNITGQQVYTGQTNEQEIYIPVTNFGTTGTYILKIIDAQLQVLATKKLILN